MNRSKTLAASLMASIVAVAVNAATNEPLLIAAASSMRPVLDQAVAEFSKLEPGMEAKVSYGASGSLCSQIANGAPFDLFLSADTNYPSAVVAGGSADSSDLFVYAYGRLALWVPVNTPFDVKQAGLSVLANAAVKKVAIANPAHAPYGRAAEKLLKDKRLYEVVSPKLVLGENVNQAAQFAQSGAVDAALIPVSLATTAEMKKAGTFLVLDAEDCPRIEHGGVIIKASPHTELARRFRDWLLSQSGAELLKNNGFEAPANAH